MGRSRQQAPHPPPRPARDPGHPPRTVGDGEEIAVAAPPNPRSRSSEITNVFSRGPSRSPLSAPPPSDLAGSRPSSLQKQNRLPLPPDLSCKTSPSLP